MAEPQGLRRKAEVLQFHKDNIEAELGRLRNACGRRGEHNDLMKLKLQAGLTLLSSPQLPFSLP